MHLKRPFSTARLGTIGVALAFYALLLWGMEELLKKLFWAGIPTPYPIWANFLEILSFWCCTSAFVLGTLSIVQERPKVVGVVAIIASLGFNLLMVYC